MSVRAIDTPEDSLKAAQEVTRLLFDWMEHPKTWKEREICRQADFVP